MEQLHMNRLRDLINRLRAGESERRIARDRASPARPSANIVTWPKPCGYLRPDQPLPDDATLRSALGPGPSPGDTPPPRRSSLNHDVVQQLLTKASK